MKLFMILMFLFSTIRDWNNIFNPNIGGSSNQKYLLALLDTTAFIYLCYLFIDIK